MKIEEMCTFLHALHACTHTHSPSFASGTEITNPSSLTTAHLLRHVCVQHQRVRKNVSRIFIFLEFTAEGEVSLYQAPCHKECEGNTAFKNLALDGSKWSVLLSTHFICRVTFGSLNTVVFKTT